MATWPTLSKPNRVTVQNITRAMDPTIRTPMEAGYTITRARFTRSPKQWLVTFSSISTADKDLLVAHEVAQNVGGDYFAWTAPHNATSYNVCYAEPIKYDPVPDTNFTHWNVTLSLVEV